MFLLYHLGGSSGIGYSTSVAEVGKGFDFCRFFFVNPSFAYLYGGLQVRRYLPA